jgi:hypothetical protein
MEVDHGLYFVDGEVAPGLLPDGYDLGVEALGYGVSRRIAAVAANIVDLP